MKSTRLMRVIHPNQGTKGWFAKKLTETISWFKDSVVDETILSLFYERERDVEPEIDFPDYIPAWETPVMDYDLVSVDDKVAKRFKGVLDARLSYWERRMDRIYKRHDEVARIRDRIEGRMKEDPANTIREFANEMPRSAKKTFKALKAVSGEIADKFVLNMARDTTSNQRNALLGVGVSPQFLDARWLGSIKATKHIYAGTAQELPRVIHDCAELVTRISAEECIRLQKVLVRSIQGKESTNEIVKVLRTFDDVSEKRAKGIALDQSNKLAFFVQSSNARSLGITKAVWVHVAGRLTYRPTHKAMDGQVFDLNTGLFDSDVGRFVLPSECPYCRCKARFVLPKELLNE